MTELVGIYGVGGFGREILPVVRDNTRGSNTRLVFVDDGSKLTNVNGHQVLSFDVFRTAAAASKSICIAVGVPKVREILVRKCEEAGIRIRGARAANVISLDDVTIGLGACLCPFVALMSNIRIGNFFHANAFSLVSHDCVIGDFVTLAPGARCNGNIVVEDYAYVGAGAVIRQGKPGEPIVIGRGAMVGMGAVVTRNVAPGDTVVGNPARTLRKD